MAVHHKPQLTIRQATNGKYRFRVSRFAPNRNGDKPGQENLATSQMFADKGNASQGFVALLDAMLIIAQEKGILMTALQRTDIYDHLNDGLGAPEAVQDFVGQRPPERPPRKPGEMDNLNP